MMGSFGGLLRGFKLGVELAGDISRRQYTDEAREGMRADRQNKYPSEDPNGPPTKSPLDPAGTGAGTTTTDTSKGDQLSGSGSTDTLTGSAGKDDLKGGNFVQNVFNYYRSKGLSPAAAAGWAGNFMQESGGASDVLQGKRKGDAGASGYAGQWQGKRQQNLLAFAKSRGRSTPSLSDQLDFALEEGKADSPYRDDVWAANAHKLDAAKTPQEATAIIRKFFERPSADDLGKRTAYALQATGDGGGFTDVAGGTATGDGGGDTLADSVPPPEGQRVASGVLPEPDDGYGETKAPEVASARLSIDTPEVDTSLQQPEFQIAGVDPRWAESTMFAAGGGAIPDFTSGSSILGTTDEQGTDTGDKDSGFGWGSILKGAGLPQGGTAREAGLGGTGDFGAGGGFANANYGAGNAPMSGWFNRDDADAQAAQAGRNARMRMSAQQAAGQANLLANQKRAAEAEAARQAALAAAQAPKPVTPAVVKPAVKPAVKPVVKPAAKPLVAKPNPVVTTGTTPVPLTKPLDPPKPTPIMYTDQGSGSIMTQKKVWRKDPATGKMVEMPASAKFMPGATRGTQNGITIYEGGGAIPEPEQSAVMGFAKGGSVDSSLFGGYFTKREPKATNRDERFRQLLKEESRGSGAGGQGGNARDRAARRLSAEEGRPSSTYYKSGGGGKKAAPGGGAPIKAGPDKITTRSTPKPELADPHTNVTPGPKPEIADPHTNVKPSPEISDPHINVTPGPTPEIADPHTNVTPSGEISDPHINVGPSPEISDPHINVGALPEPPEEDTPDADISGHPTGMPPPNPPLESGNAGQPPLYTHQDTEAAQRDRAVRAIRTQQELQKKFPNMKFDPDLPPAPAAAEPPAPAPTPPAPPAPPKQPAVVPPIAATGVTQPSPVPPVAATGVTQPSITPPVAATGATAPEPGTMPTSEQAGFLRYARRELDSGRDPAAVADMLTKLGVPHNLWAQLGPGLMGFARGGAIPDPQEGGGGSLFASLPMEGSGISHAEPMQATPKLRNDVAKASYDGLQFLKKQFGLGGGAADGAIPTPDDPAIRAQGAQRMANGEGAADDDEIANLNQQIDPNNQLAAADKEMLRLAAIHSWFLEHGQPEKAGGVAASLLQYGAQRVQQIGGLAAGAYSKYQQTGDPKDLDAVAGLLEKAYEMIPNGAHVNISVGDSGRLNVEHTDIEGKTSTQDIGPNEIGGYLQKAMTGQGYWAEIAKEADPKGYQSQLDEGRQVREGERLSRREQEQALRDRGWAEADAKKKVQEDIDKEERTRKAGKEDWAEQHTIVRGESEADKKEARKQALEDAAAAATAEERKALRDAKLKIIEKQAVPGEDKMDAAAYNEAISNAAKAKKQYDADPTPENKETMDTFVAEAYRKNGHDASKLEALGYDVTSTDMSAEAPPMPGWKKGVSNVDGKTYWSSPDGTQKIPAEAA